MIDTCPCGETLPCALDDTGYPWCVRCMDHHRHPESCAGITPDGDDAVSEAVASMIPWTIEVEPGVFQVTDLPPHVLTFAHTMRVTREDLGMDPGPERPPGARPTRGQTWGHNHERPLFYGGDTNRNAGSPGAEYEGTSIRPGGWMPRNPRCRHRGGTEDCLHLCMVVYGDRFTSDHPAPGATYRSTAPSDQEDP